MVQILLVIIAAGVLLWALNSFVPMDGQIKKLLNIVVVLVLVLWLLQVFGVIRALNHVHV